MSFLIKSIDSASIQGCNVGALSLCQMPMLNRDDYCDFVDATESNRYVTEKPHPFPKHNIASVSVEFGSSESAWSRKMKPNLQTSEESGTRGHEMIADNLWLLKAGV